ncbi:ABC-F family ATP-binding cassette domain-containing protein [Flavobacterium sp. 245]|uniref:ABC-F family ATP-binding cassette domain-containing protein n=1 Tax=Flavobacterium sp. 245 TaxID=2512115 RepID=UPI001060C0DE|nr:ABC-F family ATP-binding cassette domain-containing protein [Flavobacterium sp. 245]TDP03239.1 ATPase subunit of ABC transporter with duplicated ATPase domains [Flavobacterium sp. 245]
MIILQNISYTHSNKELLFNAISLTVNTANKIALTGHNGAGKSTLLKIIAKELFPSSGTIEVEAEPYYIPQIFGQYNHLTIAAALQIDQKLAAFHEILNGNVSETNLNLLNDDWTIEERCNEALYYWKLNDFDLNQKMESLSGGQKTKVFLAGIAIHQPKLVLLDEPSNHLDIEGRNLLYQFIKSSTSTMLIVSHDRKLLNLLDTTCELKSNGIKTYGGNYDFYLEQKNIEKNALTQDIHSKEKALQKAKEKQRETIERQQKLDAKGKKKQEKAGVARIMMNTLKNKAENSSSKAKSVHDEKIGGISQELRDLREGVSSLDKMKFGLDNSRLHKGKIIVTAESLNYIYKDEAIWKTNLNFQILSGERIALKGNNGSGKTTLIKLILNEIKPKSGILKIADCESVYIDQDYSLINNAMTVYEQAQQYNASGFEEHDIKMRLNRFLFGKSDWDKPCQFLSGGERMRLLLCGLTIANQAPDLIILDEPTNNLDLQNIEILTNALNEYQGTLIVVSHDETFLKEINISNSITLI